MILQHVRVTLKICKILKYVAKINLLCMQEVMQILLVLTLLRQTTSMSVMRDNESVESNTHGVIGSFTACNDKNNI